MTDSSALLSEIVSLLDAPPSERPARDVVEHTLTNGYAHALLLETRRLRVEGRLRAAVRGESGGEQEALAVELAQADRELAHLRGLLSTLRARALT